MKNLKEVRQLLSQMILEGNSKSGEYKGFKWSIERVYHSGHLCGYIYFDKDATDEQYEIMKSNFHGGVSWGLGGHKREGKYGFDCAHGCDLSPYELFTGMDNHIKAYRTMDYVENIIKDTIDLLHVE